jgi:hypothetical protein
MEGLRNILHEKYEKENNDSLFKEVSKKSKFLNTSVIKECEEGYYESAVLILKRSTHKLSNMSVRKDNIDAILDCLDKNIVRDVSKKYNTTITNILKALYAPDCVLYKTHTVDNDDIITMKNVLDGKYKMGDESSDLKISMLHPRAFEQLRNEEDFNTYKDTYKNKTGMELIECDLLPIEKEKYFSFLIGKNSIRFKNILFETQVYTHYEKGELTYYIHATGQFYLYLNGVIFNSIKNCPDDEELANPNNWERIAKDNKDIKIIALLNPISMS